MRIHTLFFLFLILIAACGQVPEKDNKPRRRDSSTQLLPIKEMRSDLSVLWSAITDMHPAYGIYTPADSLENIYQATQKQLDTPMTEADFISHMYPLISALRCGHTQLHFSKNYKGSKATHLPFEVLVDGERAWITFHQTDSVSTGDEVININDTPANAIIRHGADLYAMDGYNKTFKEIFLSEYGGFDDACGRYYHWKAPYRVTVRAKDGHIKTIMAASMPSDAPQAAPVTSTDNKAGWVKATGEDQLPLQFSRDNSTAWLEVGPYQYGDTTVFKQAFIRIHKAGVKNLVLDLRHNTGGDIRIAMRLMSYLADSSYHMIADLQSRLPDPSVNHFEKLFDTAVTAGFRTGFVPGPKEGRWYHIDASKEFGDLMGLQTLDPQDHFNGRLFVLIDGATFSSGAHTAIAIRRYCKTAVFIGRETAGASDGCSGGTIQHLTLPNTGVIVEFPWMRVVSVAAKPVFGRGVMPDYPVEYKPEDIIRKTDLDIRKALTLIRKS